MVPVVDSGLTGEGVVVETSEGVYWLYGYWLKKGCRVFVAPSVDLKTDKSLGEVV